MSIRPKDAALAKKLEKELIAFSKSKQALPGIASANNRACLIEQILESIHRIQYIELIQKRPPSPFCADPLSDAFDPLKAALINYRNGNIDEAFWLVFLSVHCGRHRTQKWRLCRDIYGGQDKTTPWTWTRTAADPQGFRAWLDSYLMSLNASNTPGGFSSHRKYESLKNASNRGTATVVESYINWIGANHGHELKMHETLEAGNGNPAEAFDYLYNTMDVLSFGRLAKFDFLTMIGKLGFAPIEPGSPYLKGATGPLNGACLLFGVVVPPSSNVELLNSLVVKLGKALEVGMQVMEDSLCNWQKSPDNFIAFRG